MSANVGGAGGARFQFLTVREDTGGRDVVQISQGRLVSIIGVGVSVGDLGWWWFLLVWVFWGVGGGGVVDASFVVAKK